MSRAVYYEKDEYEYLITHCPFYPENLIGGYSCAQCSYFCGKNRKEQLVRCSKKED